MSHTGLPQGRAPSVLPLLLGKEGLELGEVNLSCTGHHSNYTLLTNEALFLGMHLRNEKKLGLFQLLFLDLAILRHQVVRGMRAVHWEP